MFIYIQNVNTFATSDYWNNEIPAVLFLNQTNWPWFTLVQLPAVNVFSIMFKCVCKPSLSPPPPPPISNLHLTCLAHCVRQGLSRACC